RLAASRRHARPPRPLSPEAGARGVSRGDRRMSLPNGYSKATRHPWPSLLFVLPLLAAYEAGVIYLGGANPETIRNGADHWLRCALGVIGVQFFWVPPAVLAVFFVFWTARRWTDRPGDL